MSLPEGCAYPMPGDADLPATRVTWTLEPARAALLIHDMQNYFMRPFRAGESPLVPLLANITALRRACHARGVPVFYTAQPGNQDPALRGLQSDFWGPGMTSVDAHQAIVGELTPEGSDTVVTKWRYSAFQRAPFEDLLRERGCTQLVVAGVYASIGCTLTAAEAFMRDIQPFFVIDAVADFSRERHDLATRFVAERCATPTTTRRVVDTLGDNR